MSIDLNAVNSLLLGGGVLIAISVYFIHKFSQNKSEEDGQKKNEKNKTKGVVGANILLADDTVKYKITLKHVDQLSHDTRKFRFELPRKDQTLGLPVGKHVYLSTRVNDKLVVRPYTPVSRVNDKGFVEFVIKVYFKNVHPKFPDGGKMSQYLNEMELDQQIDIRGPSGLLTYTGDGNFLINRDKKDLTGRSIHVTHISMIAGGSGITPMFQVLSEILDESSPNMNNEIKLSLLYANQTEDDILLKRELETFQSAFGDRFKLWFTVDRPLNPEGWQYSKGFVTEAMISEHLFKPDRSASSSLVLLCGPPPMIKFACLPNLEKIGFNSDMIHVF